MRSLWQHTNLSWVWTWMAVYNCSLSMLAAFTASTFTAAVAHVLRGTTTN